MKKIVFVFVLCASSIANAVGNPDAGQEKSASCVACHGPAGISSNPEWPSLAGQHAAYIEKQLQYFKIGKKRYNPLMAPIVADLNQQDMADLAAYYSSLPLPKQSTPEKFLSPGEQLYRGGNFEKHITACIACHGPRGLGNAQANFPVLSGQQPVYTMQTLLAFKTNQRQSDANDIMRDIASRMSKDDMEAVAYYVAGLH